MANVFGRSTGVAVGTGVTTLYTCPADTSTTLIGITVCNVTASDVIEVAATAVGAHVVKNFAIQPGEAISALEGKIVLTPGDTVTIESDTASSADVIVSYLEIT